jgi:hypothetical protein
VFEEILESEVQFRQKRLDFSIDFTSDKDTSECPSIDEILNLVYKVCKFTNANPADSFFP